MLVEPTVVADTGQKNTGTYSSGEAYTCSVKPLKETEQSIAMLQTAVMTQGRSHRSMYPLCIQQGLTICHLGFAKFISQPPASQSACPECIPRTPRIIPFTPSPDHPTPLCTTPCVCPLNYPECSAGHPHSPGVSLGTHMAPAWVQWLTVYANQTSQLSDGP